MNGYCNIRYDQIRQLRRWLANIQPERRGSVLTGLHPLTPGQRLELWQRKKAARQARVAEIIDDKGLRL